MFLSSAGFLKKSFFLKKMPKGIPTECQAVWFQIRPNILLGLVWVQTVCKNYQQTILVAKELHILIL